MTDPEADVPYGEDFHDPAVAAAWADGVMRRFLGFAPTVSPD